MAVSREDLERAARTLEAELAVEKSARLFAPLAEAYRLQGKLDAARDTAREGLRLFPTHMAVRIVLARTLTDARDGAGALAAYREVLVHDPANAEARAYLESRASRRPERADAAEARPAPRTQPRAGDEAAPCEPTASASGLAEELGQLADLFSPRGVAAALPDDTVSGIATLTLAEIYARQGLLDKAIEVCQTILARRPGDSEAAERLRRYQEELASVT